MAHLNADDRPLGATDVLRLRFWLMLLLQKARHENLAKGLATDCEELGWPKMTVRVLAAFFMGKKPPITRLMISREYTEMPPDFLESWTTAIWSLSLIDAALGKSPREEQFRSHVLKLKASVARVLGLTPAELSSATVVDLMASLDSTIGARVLKYGPTQDTPIRPREMSRSYRAILQR